MSNKKAETAFLVFTDIEGSTGLASRLKAKFAGVLEIHNQIIRSAIEKFDGVEIDNAGDGFFIIFKKPEDSVHFAIEVQKEITKHQWPDNNALKLRIGLHVGKVFKNKDTYIGEEVNRCSRICDTGYGGQVILSSNMVLRLADAQLKVEIFDKGYFALKDFHTPMQLFQLHIAGIGDRSELPRSWAANPILAILPFKVHSTEKQDEGFGLGIAEDLIINLSKIPDLRVVSRSSSFALKDTDPIEAGAKLKATAILEGSIRKENDRIRISTFLVEVASGLNLWSEQFEGETKKMFSFQDDISYKITEVMRVGDGFKTHRGITAMHSEDVGAYQYYLRGRRFFYQFSENSVQFGIRMYRKAIDMDPQYALAYCGLAECYSYLFMYSKTDKRNLLQADQSSKVAIKLDPQLAEAWSSRGMVLSLQKNYDEATLCFDKAIQIDPMLFEARYQYARLSFTMGLLEKATDLYAKALEIRPDDYQSPLLAAQSYEVMGQPEKALEMRKRGIEIAEENLKLNPGDTRALSLAANGLAAIDEKEKAMNFLHRALLLEPEDPMLLYNAGCIYAMCGFDEEALNCLEKSAETGLTQKEWYIHDDNLDPIREHERFKRMLQGMK